MKFGQLVVYNVRDIFLRNRTENVEKYETSPRPLSIKSKFRLSLDRQSIKFHTVFILCPSRGLSAYIQTKVQTAGSCLIENCFKKQKEVCD